MMLCRGVRTTIVYSKVCMHEGELKHAATQTVSLQHACMPCYQQHLVSPWRLVDAGLHTCSPSTSCKQGALIA